MEEGSEEQGGQCTGAVEDKEDEGASSSDNLHQTVYFAHAPAPAPVQYSLYFNRNLPYPSTPSRSRTKEWN